VAAELDRKLSELVKAKQWQAMERVAREELERAKKAGEWRQAARMEYSRCRALQGRRQYSQVLDAGLRGRELALRVKAHDVAAFNGFCIALVYYGTNNYQLGVAAARQMLEHARLGKIGNLFAFSMLYGMLLGANGEFEGSLQVYRETLEEAARTGSIANMAEVVDRMGARHLETGSSETAEQYLLEAFRLRALLVRAQLGRSYYNLARLWLKQGKHRQSIQFAQLALRHSTEEARPEQSYLVQAQAHLALGESREALRDLRQSVAVVRRMRGRIPFGDELQMSLENRTQQIYELYALTAAEEYRRTGDRRLLEESLTAAQENRAMSLRTRSEADEGWQERLPDEYWRVAAELQRLEVEALRQPQRLGEPPQAIAMRERLTEMESRAGLPEGERTTGVVKPGRVAAGLAEGEWLITFLLAEPVSLRWIQSRREVRLERLAGRDEIEALAGQFTREVEEGKGAESVASGKRLRDALLAGVPEQGLWTVVPDGTLFQVPLAALPAADGRGYQVEKVAIRLAPTALFASTAYRTRGKGFLGIGDPVSNRADSRLTPRGTGAPALGVELSRLPASAVEVRRCAREWNGSTGARVLLGTEIDGESVRAALRERPEVVHLATHVYRPPDGSSAVITLGYGSRGDWAVLTEREIASLYPAPEVVTLSGCGSGQGALAPGTGLLGLTRAWLMAGSQVVMATRWSVRDDSGDLLEEYYRCLRQMGGEPTARKAAQALQKAQIGAIRRGGRGSGADNWGAYFVIGAI
jgi:CHAT domain-containing protein